MLDQRNLAGIGNIYRCEACFLSGIHPASPVSAVADLPALFADAKQLLEANLGPGRRTTLLNARGTPVGRAAGRPGYWVYRREHQPCLRCRTPIRHGVLGKPVPRRAFPPRASPASISTSGGEGVAAPATGLPVTGTPAAGTPAAGTPELVTEERDIYFCPKCQPLLGAGDA